MTMTSSSRPPLDEASLHALADGRLAPHEREALEARLAGEPSAAETVRAWQAQRDLLRALHPEVLHEPVPPGLAEAARQVGRAGVSLVRWQRWGGMAASVLVAFTVGWLAHGTWDGLSGGGAIAKARSADFGRQAVVAHVVYAPEVRHPVEVPAAQHEHLVQWLSKRLGRQLKVPDLAAQGYELVGGRLLPGEQGARAQFMYQNARGERITLYVGAIDPGKAGNASGETAFRFTTEDGASSFYWVDQGFGYALAGRLGRPDLLSLAETVYRQL
jgi:anti-sigma factor RsiW